MPGSDLTPHPRCQAKLKDGSLCRTHAERGSDYCAYHLKLEDASQGRQARNSNSSAETRSGSVDRRRVPVEDVRSQLARDAADEYDVLRAALLDALKAEREAYVSCPQCGKRHPVVVPDWTARVKAVETLLDQGFGQRRAASRSCDCAEQVEQRVSFVKELSDPERAVYNLARALHDIEAQLSTRTQREVQAREGRRTSKGGEDARQRLRALIIELFELEPDQQTALEKLVMAWNRIWQDPEEIRLILRGQEPKR